MSKQVMQQALDALEIANNNLASNRAMLGSYTTLWDKYESAIIALREELAQPESVSGYLACDRSYLNGLRAGFTFGHLGQEEEFRKSESAYSLSIASVGIK